MARKRRVQRGVLRPYVRETASGERWWWVVVPRHGRKSLGLRESEASREDAFRAAVERFSADDQPRGAAPSEKSLIDLARAYLSAPHGWTARTKHSTELRLSAFVASMGALHATHPSHLTDVTLDAWRTARLAVVSRATVNRDETVARSLLAWGASQSPPLCAATPFAKRALVREPSRPRRRVIHSPAQMARLVSWALDHGHEGWALTAGVLESTGWRIDEARRADATWITATGVRLSPESGPGSSAWTSKGYRVREVELSREALDVVRRWMAARDEPHGRTGLVGLSERWYATIADRAAKALGLPTHARPHDARRRWVTELVRRGVPLATVRDLIGHADVQTTERYVCTYHDDPATVSAPSVASVDVLTRPRESGAQVLPLRRGGR